MDWPAVSRGNTNSRQEALMVSIWVSLLITLAAVNPTAARRPAARSGGAVTAGAASLPWVMADDERAKLRTTTGSGNPSRVRAESTSPAGYSESIDGKTHPELFMPYELYDYLLLGLSADDRRAKSAHDQFDPQFEAMGYEPATFWNTVRNTAGPYLQIRLNSRRTVMAFTTEAGKHSWVPTSREACLERVLALQRARKSFEPQEFDRLLYIVVARKMVMSGSGTTDQPEHYEQLRFMARGCK